MRSHSGLLVAALCGAVLFGAAQVHAQSVVTLDLPAASLADSLRALAMQTHSNILFDRNLVAGISAKPLKAELSLSQALDTLLEGTGLSYRNSDDKTVLIVSAPAGGKPPAESDHSDNRDMLQEVIVTAQKREERLQEVPVSVSVLGSAQMLASHQNNLVDYAATVPGLQVESLGPGRSTLTLRGLALHGDGATVGTYIDDVPVGPSGSGQSGRVFAPELLPYDLDRIEVLRGPQGTFYGANALGGLVKYVTKAPDLHQSQLSAGSDLLWVQGGGSTGYTVRVGGNAPLIDDRLALRVSYGRDYTPGYIDVPGLNRQDVNRTTRQSGNVALLWQATDALSLKLTGLVETLDIADNALVRLDAVSKLPVLGYRDAVTHLAQPFRETLQLYSTTLKYDPGSWSLTSVSSVATTSLHLREDNTTVYGPIAAQLTGGAVASPLASLDTLYDFRKYTQELRVATASTARLDAIAGAFFTYEEATRNSLALDAFAPDGTPLPGLSPMVAADTPSTYKEEALFGNATWRFTRRFDLSAGVRLARNEQSMRALISGPLLPADDALSHSSESVFNYSVAPRFRFNDDVMAYLRVASGYRPGGPNIVLNPAAGVPRTFKSDRITNYELGVKSTWLDKRLELNATAFQINWRDVQIGLVDFSTGTGYFDNGRTARSRGFEWESIYSPIRQLRIGLTATWLDAVLTQDLPPNATVTGKAGDQLPEAPRFAGAVTVDYSFSLVDKWNAEMGGMYRYAGSHYSGLSADPNSVRLQPYSTVDLHFGATNDSWSINLFVRNLTDRHAYVQENLLTDRDTNQPLTIDAAILQPRTVGVSIDKRF
jgi:iron complex outermembrane recepter protein